MEGVEEKVVLDRFIKMFVELSECERKKKELKEAFKTEFGIEPEVITPKKAKRTFDIYGELVKIVDDVMEATNKIPASEDEYYILVFTATYNEDNEEPHDWILVTDYSLPFLRKCTGDYVYYVCINVKRYDDC